MRFIHSIFLLFVGSEALRPLVVWHGINDDCAGFTSSLIAKIKTRAPDLYVHCIQIGDTPKIDYRNSLFMLGQKQLEIACARVNADENLKNGFNAFGISQGGLFLRALIQTCPPSEVHNFVTFSAPHQGIFGIPNCFKSVPAFLCRFISKSLTHAAYTPQVQKLFTPIQYWHDPLREEAYRQKSQFAAIYNNERNFNATFKQNLLKVKNFVLARNTEDEVIVPRESSHFAYYREGQGREIVNFTSTRVFKEDLIGLKELYDSGRLTFLEVPGRHMQSPYGWLEGITSDYFVN
ncbi:palmitoyl-protein thioesterase 1 [Galendromus occidentalis]|uniref:Palmitoyl-protein thioesterase 1 n=1 Tax=Galendromus occidentalis TaxID=34638 RepID=A0AAJ7L5M1_9ACAR|nr:palmitoyl-protein thioesterase 1 [Galendromus occidentalis]